jgi:hypothetical protein
MNERIYEAAKQAGLLPRHIGPVVETRHTAKKKQDLEKFAELIVQECAQQCWTVSELESKGSVVNECAKRIRKHFGIEE